MKVGSLVVCVDELINDEDVHPVYKGKIYTVRDIFQGLSFINGKTVPNGGIGVRLDEIKNKIDVEFKQEIGYSSHRFRELDTPTSISIEEILEEPFYA